MSAPQSSRVSGDGVFDLTRTAVVVTDRAGMTQGWTEGAERLLGYRVSEAVGKPLANLFTGVDPGPDPESKWRTRLAAADGWSGLEAVRHKDGHRLDLELRILPVRDTAHGSARLVLAAEMAQTPWSGASRSFLEGILGMSPIGVAMVNADLQFVWLNDALERMGGISREARLGKRLGDVQPGLAVEAIEAEMRRVLRTGLPSVGYEYLGQPQSDPQREHAYSTSFFRLEDGAGQVLGVCYMVLDVTESYRSRQRMALLNRAAERIGSSLDVWQTAQELSDAAVPDLADFVTVDLLDALLGGEQPAAGPVDATALFSMRRAGQQSVREGCPEAVVAVGERASYPPSAPVVLSLTEGNSTLLQTLDLADGDWAAEDPVHAAHLRGLGFHSLMVVPLRARGSSWERPRSPAGSTPGPSSPTTWCSPRNSSPAPRWPSTTPADTPVSTPRPSPSSTACCRATFPTSARWTRPTAICRPTRSVVSAATGSM